METSAPQALAADGKLDASDAITVLPGGEMKEAEGKDGLVFSSPKLLTNLRAAHAAWPDGLPPASVDGTYKVHKGNFVLVILGSSTLRLNERNQIVTSFRPWSFGLFPSESGVRVPRCWLLSGGTT